MAKVKEKQQKLEGLLDGLEITEQQYLDAYNEYDGIKYEYVNGRLKSIGMSVKKVERGGIFFIKLFEAFFDNPETVRGIVLSQFMFPTEGQEYIKNYRRPDICVIINDQLDDFDSKTDRMDIAIELISEGTKKADHKDKKREYELKKVAYYFVVDETRKNSKFYQLNFKNQYEEIPLKENDIIELVEIKGLQFKVSDIFSARPMNELESDKVYEYSFAYSVNKGRIEGRIEGIKIGEEKGKAEQKYEIAKTLKSEGISIEMIKKITGLNLKEIDKL